MRPSQVVRFLLGGLLAVAVGCSDSSGPGRSPVRPKAVLKISGDSQAAIRGSDLTLPLRVRVIGSDDRPLAGVPVRWAIDEGAATLNVSQNSTNASGEAEIRVTTLATMGAISASATVVALEPARFDITGLDPCYFEFVPWIDVGATVAGTLTSLSCDAGEGHVANSYNFALSDQTAVQLQLRAPGYEPLVALWLFARTWFWVMPPTQDDSHRAVLKAILRRGRYGVVATSRYADRRGPYTLNVLPATDDVMSCEDVLVISGVTTTQHLTANDCFSATGRSDKFFIVAERGERLLITETSTAFVPHLQLKRNGEVAAEADGAPSGSATIDFTSAALAVLEIHATGGAPQEGAYTLTIGSLTPVTTHAARVNPFVHDPQTRTLLHGVIP